MRKNLSAEKRLRQNLKKKVSNQGVKTAVRTAFKKADLAVSSQSKEVNQLVKDAISGIDRAAGKGIVQKNKAARKKSRLMKKLNSSLKNPEKAAAAAK